MAGQRLFPWAANGVHTGSAKRKRSRGIHFAPYNVRYRTERTLPMIGERLRDARQSQQLSLTQVATKANISAATLSRIENEKQGLGIQMLFALSRILGVSPEAMIGDGDPGTSTGEKELAQQISDMHPTDRTRLWRELASCRRGPARNRAGRHEATARLEELLAQVDFLRQEIEAIKLRLVKRA